MKRIMISAICMILIVAFGLGLTGCFEKSREPSNFNLHVADYSIVTRDGTHYIIFDDITVYEDYWVEMANLRFDTIEDFKQSVMNGTLKDIEKAVIAKCFKKDDVGIPVCDFNNLYVPKLPQKWSIYDVGWSGTFYAFSLTAKDGCSGNIGLFPKTTYEFKLKELEEMFDREGISVEETTVTGDNKTVVTYKTGAGRFKQITYELSDGGRKVTVKRQYCLEQSLSASPDIPQSVYMLCEDDGVYSYVSLHGFAQDPTDRWLLKFGLE